MSRKFPTDLIAYKKNKKAKLIQDDLTKLLSMLELFKKGLAYYNKYTPVRDIYFNIMNNQAILQANLDRLNNILDKKDNENEV